MICEKCNATIPDSVKFCPKCGGKAGLQITGQPSAKKCPQCGAENPAGAKFCKVDGYDLQKEVSSGVEVSGSVSPTQPTQREVKTAQSTLRSKATSPVDRGKDLFVPVEQQRQKPHVPHSSAGFQKVSLRKLSKNWVVAAIIVVIMLLAGAGGYLYFTGYLSVKPEKFQVLLNNEIQAKGVSVSAEVNGDWVVTLTGVVQNEGQRGDIVNVVKAHKEVKDVVDRMSVKKAALDVQFDINRELADGELATVQAMVDEKFIVTLTGFVSSKEGKEKAVELAKKKKEVKDVLDKVTVQDETAPTAQPGSSRSSAGLDPAKLEGEINRELRNAGLGNVTAAVDSKLIVTLKGSTKGASEKQRALGIVRGFSGVRGVKDVIFAIGGF